MRQNLATYKASKQQLRRGLVPKKKNYATLQRFRRVIPYSNPESLQMDTPSGACKHCVGRSRGRDF